MSVTVPTPPLPPIPTGVPTSPYVTIAQFRTDHPEFADTTLYPDVVVQGLLDVGSVLVRPERWRSLTPFGVELFACHMLAMQRWAMQGGQGAVPGIAKGLMSSKSVSKVSVGYDFSKTAMDGWGPFNLTLYGQQFAFYAELFGTGGYEVLADTYSYSLAGVVWTWASGVMTQWGS
jgi:hypothetical protein